MSRAESVLQHLAWLLTAGTGLVYFVMKYLLEPADPWAVVNHPLQPQVQHLHVLVAPLVVFATGLVWQRHIRPGLGRRGRRGRMSGLMLAAGFVPMVASGYLLQVAVDPAWRQVWLGVHLVTAGLGTAGYAVHALPKLLGPALAGLRMTRRAAGGTTTDLASDARRIVD